MVTQQEAIVDLLRVEGRLPLDIMERTLHMDRKIIQVGISGINAKSTITGIQILRLGKKGNSSYEIEDQNTDKTTVFNNMGRHSKSTIKHLKAYRSIGQIALTNANSLAQRQQIVKQINAEKAAMIAKIAVETS